MQVQKEQLLFCILLVFSMGLLIASNFHKGSVLPEKCPNPSKCCQKVTVPHPNASPWNLLTEGMLHIAV